MRSILALAALMMLTTGCATVTGSCPSLAPPPDEAIDALENTASNAVDAWVVDLSRHYDKLDACNGR